MKRLAWLLLIAIVSFNTAGFAASASLPAQPSTSISIPPAGPDPAPLAASIPGYNVECHNIGPTRLCTSVSAVRVKPGSFITVYGMMKERGKGVPGQVMTVVWHASSSASCIGVTDENGLASCSTYVPTTISGAHRVVVWVWLDKFKITTRFRIKDSSTDPESTD